VVERRDQTLPPFLPDTPINMLSRGEFATEPWVTGVTEAEGLYPASQFLANPEKMKWIWENFEDIAPHLLDYNFTVSDEQKAEVTQVIKKRLGPLDDEAGARLVRVRIP
jgi:bile salt-stimulated lipase